jgi:hypothetical protein
MPQLMDRSRFRLLSRPFCFALVLSRSFLLGMRSCLPLLCQKLTDSGHRLGLKQ